MASATETLAAVVAEATHIPKLGMPQRTSALEPFPQVRQLASAYPGILSTQWLGGSDGSDAALPISVFATLHALRIAYEVRKGAQMNGRRPLLQELFTMLTFSFGGAILTALALGRPQPWLENNVSVPIYGGVYLLMGFMPGDFLFKFLRRTAPISDTFLASTDGLMRGYGVTASGVDLVRKKMSGQPIAGSLIAWIFVGTVLGSGGGIIDDLMQISRANWSFRTPTMVRNGPSLDVKLSFFATIGYILTTHAWSFVENVPGFPLSSILDSILNLVPHFTDEEARLLSGLMCSAVLGTAALRQASKYTTFERNAERAAIAKKNDDISGGSRISADDAEASPAPGKA